MPGSPLDSSPTSLDQVIFCPWHSTTATGMFSLIAFELYQKEQLSNLLAENELLKSQMASMQRLWMDLGFRMWTI